MRVLLTGASGYVGSAILDRLVSTGCEVRVLALPETVGQLVHRDRIDVLEGTVRDADLLRRATHGIDVVHHFAAALPSQKAQEIIDVNVKGTASLLAASVDNGVRRFVLASSMAVYNPVLRRSRWPITEESPLLEPGRRTRSQYPRSKIDAEAEVHRAHEEKGLEYVILRFPIVYGCGAPLVENYLQTILSRPALIASRASTAPGMQWIHASDLAAAVALAGTRPEAANQTFNIAGDALFSMRDMLASVAEQKGIQLPPMREVGAVAQALGDRLSSGPALKYDIRKADRLLGFQPQASLRDSLREIAADMDRRGLLPRNLDLPSPTSLRALAMSLLSMLPFRARRRPAA